MLRAQYRMNHSEAIAALDSILDQADTGILTPNGDLCNDLLKFLSMHPELGSKIAEIFAILARESSFRDVANEHDVLANIVPILKSTDVHSRLQALRAVGNLCIDHDPNREKVLSNGGCVYLINQLSKCVDSTTEEWQSDRIKCITCGCILNVANSNGLLSKELLDLDVINGLVQLISVPSQSENVVEMALQTLAVLLDHAKLDSLLKLPYSTQLMHVLKHCIEGKKDVCAVAIEIIGILVENDEWKLHLVENRFIDKLLEIEESSLIKRVMDIIILIVAEDKCLHLICTENKVLSKTMEWLSSDDLPLEAKASAVLIVANIARSDGNCLFLVEKGIVPLLISLLKIEEPEEVYGKLHHSALSALRNLSIPSQNKALFLQLGVVDTGLNLLKKSTQAHVQMKAIGLLRLLAEKQAETCCHIIMEEGLIDRVCEICAAVGPIHLQSEGSRLLAALVKYCKSSELMSKIATKRSMKCLYKLLESEHVLMITDGLVALSLLAAIQNDIVFEIIKETGDLSMKLCSIIASWSTSTEIVSNALTLIDKLCLSGTIKCQLSASMELKTALKRLNLCDYSKEMKVLLENVSHKLDI